ncbi:hypothetical protein [Niastella sp. OAS944]|uniref:hypothetical protein n=1 Tax=Niastella sp. OAS944 TaxID=2664089 RepID=UPI0034783F3C|nr:starvation-inducible outer membrane lipoprotein [Chitinophagaceae bacterium OAS944]
MKTTSFIIIALALLTSCGSQPEKTEKQSNTQEKAKEEIPMTCYQYASQGDTVSLKLVHLGDSYSGSLVYLFKEKDRNMGTIQGVMRGDILVADYTFNSEGTKSIRQVAFKKVGNTYVEGYGESVEENGAMKFKDITSLNFGSSIVLQEIACQ